MKYYNSPENPEFLNSYMVHQKVVKMLAERTIEEYCLDIRLFLKYIRSQSSASTCPVEEVDISDMTEDELRKISVSDIYNFLFYAADDRKNNQYSRYRKTSSSSPTRQKAGSWPFGSSTRSSGAVFPVSSAR